MHEAVTVAPSDRDRAILRSFADRIEASDPGAHNNLGVLYFRKGMTAEAVAAFTRALELDARMTIAQRNLEIACFTSGYYDARVQDLQARLAAAPGDRHARWELGRTYFLLGDVQRALAEYGALLQDDPDDVQVIRQVAMAEAKCGDLEAAWRWLRRGLEIEPDNPAVLFHVGELAYQRGLNEEARAALSRAVELSPGDADALHLLSFVLGDQGDHEGAKSCAARALRLNPALGRARTNLSLERFDPRSYHKAQQERVARGLPDARGAAEAARLAHFNLGLAFRQKGYLEEALREYATALERGEDPGLTRQAMAEVQLLRGDMRAALALYERLVADQPQNARHWNGRGVALHHAGRYAEARASYEEALARDPDGVAPLNNLGVAAFHGGDLARAMDAFDRALQVNAGCIKARLNRALLLVRQDDVQGALDAYRQVLRLAPDHPTAWNGVGHVLSRLKRFEDARNAFAKAIEARPDYAEARYNLSFALSHLNDYAGALRETRRALELDPFYTAQKFELAMDLEHEDPRLELAPEVAGERRDATVSAFVFEPRTLDELFDELSTGARPPDAAGGEAPYQRAHALLAAGDHDGALAEVRRALGSGAPRAVGLVAWGDVFLARGAGGEALERYREARRLDGTLVAAVRGEVRALIALRRFGDATAPAEWLATHDAVNVDSLLLVARVRQETGNAREARATLLAARRLAPARGDVSLTLGRLARQQGDHAAAIRAYQEAITLDAAPAEAGVELAELLMARGERAGAERELERAVAAQPRSAAAILALARARREAGRPEDAVPLLAGFLARDPWHLDAIASLGESLFLIGRRDDARFAFARVRRFDADHVAALYFEGVMLAQDGDYDAAIALWRQVIERDPVAEFGQRARRDTRMAEALRGALTGRRSEEAA